MTNRDKFKKAIKTIKNEEMKLAITVSEMRDLCSEISEVGPTVFVEIGSRRGGSLYVLSQFCSKGATIISVDLPGAKWGNKDSEISLKNTIKILKSEGFDSHLIIGDSHHEGTKSQIKKILQNRKIDFLFLDGDHTYDGVKQDWDMYSSLVSNCVGFHDIFTPGNTQGVNVSKLWAEVKKEYRHKEFISKYGIGILFKDKD